MKLIQKQVDKLREGKATLVADHSKPEMMKKIFGGFYIRENDWSYYYKCADDNQEWDACSEHVLYKYKRGELIPLADFFEDEETGVEEIEFKSYNPKTAEERDQIVKKLQAMEFKKKLPSELSGTYLHQFSNNEALLMELLRMRDVYRDGWVSKENDNYSIELRSNKDFEIYHYDCKTFSSSFSFQNKEIAELFLSNFKEDLEQVKHLIS